MIFRKATKNDIEAIMKIIANDKLGKTRENVQYALPQSYLEAFEIINKDPNQELMVVEDENMEVVGTFQLTFIQYLTYQGGVRAQVESVHVRKDKTGQGIGKKMFEWIIQRAKDKKAHLLQLTTDKQRPGAINFYQNLGFTASHEGMKMHFK